MKIVPGGWTQPKPDSPEKQGGKKQLYSFSLLPLPIFYSHAFTEIIFWRLTGQLSLPAPSEQEMERCSSALPLLTVIAKGQQRSKGWDQFVCSRLITSKSILRKERKNMCLPNWKCLQQLQSFEPFANLPCNIVFMSREYMMVFPYASLSEVKWLNYGIIVKPSPSSIRPFAGKKTQKVRAVDVS